MCCIVSVVDISSLKNLNTDEEISVTCSVYEIKNVLLFDVFALNWSFRFYYFLIFFLNTTKIRS